MSDEKRDDSIFTEKEDDEIEDNNDVSYGAETLSSYLTTDDEDVIIPNGIKTDYRIDPAVLAQLENEWRNNEVVDEDETDDDDNMKLEYDTYVMTPIISSSDEKIRPSKKRSHSRKLEGIISAADDDYRYVKDTGDSEGEVPSKKARKAVETSKEMLVDDHSSDELENTSYSSQVLVNIFKMQSLDDKNCKYGDGNKTEDEISVELEYDPDATSPIINVSSSSSNKCHEKIRLSKKRNYSRKLEGIISAAADDDRRVEDTGDIEGEIPKKKARKDAPTISSNSKQQKLTVKKKKVTAKISKKTFIDHSSTSDSENSCSEAPVKKKKKMTIKVKVDVYEE